MSVKPLLVAVFTAALTLSGAPAALAHSSAAPSEEVASASGSSAARIAVDTAVAQVGDPYRWGGAGPHSFDCSGLTMYSWGAAGVHLPHSSRAQHGVTDRVHANRLQPGDLLFYYRPVSHVAMYIGDGQMIDAPSRGRSVQIRPVRWSGLVGAGRPDA